MRSDGGGTLSLDQVARLTQLDWASDASRPRIVATVYSQEVSELCCIPTSTLGYPHQTGRIVATVYSREVLNPHTGIPNSQTPDPEPRTRKAKP